MSRSSKLKYWLSQFESGKSLLSLMERTKDMPEKEQIKQFKKWQKERKQVAGKPAHQTD